MNKSKKKAAAPKSKTPAHKSRRIKKPAVKKPAPRKTSAPKASAKVKIASIAKPAGRAMPKPVSSKNPKGNLKVSQETSSRKRLNKEELKYFEKLLNDKKETLIQELDYLEDNTMRLNSKNGAGDLSSHAYHLADHATETQDREQSFHLASREGRYLFYIEEALERVRAGIYGQCKNCGKLIPKARLEAVPTAKMCIDCKAKQEMAIESEIPV
jgi:DnaK suppressor protein